MTTLPTDEEIARAEALGELTARDGGTISDNPWPWDCSLSDRVLRMRWAMAFAGAGGADRLLRLRDRVVAGARRAWYGDEEP
jgi:hypothetical protein